MSDEHRGLSHDMPEYVPNWPVPAKVKAKVMKGGSGWMYSHACPRHQAIVWAYGLPSQPAACAAALKHARGCW